jgi:hypothetical protein
MINIDGSDDYGCYAGDATKGPYVLFDQEQQRNVAGPFRWYWQAWLALLIKKRQSNPVDCGKKHL